MDMLKIIQKPLYTERGAQLKEQQNRFVFRVAVEATKTEIKHAVEKLFKVSVINVHTAIVPGKKRRMGSHEGVRSDWKKAIVKLKKGQEIKPIDVQT